MKYFEKKYNEALERASNLHKDAVEMENNMTIKTCEIIFPELKDSEDEKIRKELIAFVKSRLAGFPQCDKYLVWLEKQVSPDIVADAYLRGCNDTEKKWIEKQDEQETLCTKCRKEQPSHSCQDITELGRCAVEHEQKANDNVELKFKIGDWVVYMGATAKILDLQKHYYVGIDTNGKDFVVSYYNEYELKKWTIQDAKDGDVLVDLYGNIGIFEKRYGLNWHTYCYLGNKGRFSASGGSHGSICYPATKEQRDLLFSKMKEAGYKLDKDFNLIKI